MCNHSYSPALAGQMARWQMLLSHAAGKRTDGLDKVALSEQILQMLLLEQCGVI